MAYAPAVSTTTSPLLPHLNVTYYSRKALSQVKKQFRFAAVSEPDEIPRRSGKNVQWYRYLTLGANITPAPEGTVGAAVPQQTATVTATVSEYADFSSISTLADEVAIDPITTNHATNLGYRGGLTVDTIVRTEFDSNLASVSVATAGAYATVFDLKKCVAFLRGNDVLPKEDNEFHGIIHPYAVFDIQADNTAGGFVDVMKWAKPSVFLEGQAAADGSMGEVGGVRMWTTTNVGTSGTAPNVLYNIYVVGAGAVGRVALQGSGPNYVVDPAVVGSPGEEFNVKVVRGGPNPADPEGMIGSFVSYRFVFVAKTLDSTTFRYRILQADASLV